MTRARSCSLSPSIRRSPNVRRARRRWQRRWRLVAGIGHIERLHGNPWFRSGALRLRHGWRRRFGGKRARPGSGSGRRARPTFGERRIDGESEHERARVAELGARRRLHGAHEALLALPRLELELKPQSFELSHRAASDDRLRRKLGDAHAEQRLDALDDLDAVRTAARRAPLEPKRSALEGLGARAPRDSERDEQSESDDPIPHLRYF